MIIKNEREFIELRKAGRLVSAGTGSERGYCAQYHSEYGFVYCGIVRRGHRAGLHKIQLTGKGGPHSNSSQYITNHYYKEV